MAGVYNITIEQGSTFNLSLVLKNSDETYFDLTPWAARGQIRKTYSSVDVIASFSFLMTDPTNGAMTISLSSGITATIDKNFRYVWDFELYRAIPGGEEVKRILEGTVSISPEVTR